MNKLNELIQQFCPDGVEYKTLGEIATDIYRGSGIKREQVTVSGIPCVRYGEIYTTYGIWFDKCVSHTDVSLISGPKYFEHGDILFAITGESVEDIAKSCAYVGHEKCLAGGDIGRISEYAYDGEFITWTTDGANAGTVFFRNGKFNITNVCGLLSSKYGDLNLRYLYYVLSKDAGQYVNKGMGNAKLMSNVMGGIKIAVPPLSIQNRIANVLDNFDAICSDLNIGLPAEIEARQKQYEYYRDKLLTFKERISI